MNRSAIEQEANITAHKIQEVLSQEDVYLVVFGSIFTNSVTGKQKVSAVHRLLEGKNNLLHAITAELILKDKIMRDWMLRTVVRAANESPAIVQYLYKNIDMPSRPIEEDDEPDIFKAQ
jgi:hypothetical protein